MKPSRDGRQPSAVSVIPLTDPRFVHWDRASGHCGHKFAGDHCGVGCGPRKQRPAGESRTTEDAGPKSGKPEDWAASDFPREITPNITQPSRQELIAIRSESNKVRQHSLIPIS